MNAAIETSNGQTYVRLVYPATGAYCRHATPGEITSAISAHAPLDQTTRLCAEVHDALANGQPDHINAVYFAAIGA